MDADHNPDVAVVEREPQPVLSIRRTVELAHLAEAQGESLRELWSSIRRRGVRTAGPPFVRYHTFGELQTDLERASPWRSAQPARAEPPSDRRRGNDGSE
jgi:hypothetical protein